MIFQTPAAALFSLPLLAVIGGCNNSAPVLEVGPASASERPMVQAQAAASDEQTVAPITGAVHGDEDADKNAKPAGGPKICPITGAVLEDGMQHPDLDACPINGGWEANDLIQEGETHFARLWQLTRGGENAEGYFSFSGDRLSLQARNPDWGINCDRIYVMGGENAKRVQVSNGHGTTTCAYFMPDDKHVIFASTHMGMDDCPPPADHSKGYTWSIYPEHDIWIKNLETGELNPFITGPGYDAEATVSPMGDRVVFTSTRSGDIELWTSDLEGGDLQQVTDTIGYDGGGFFSHDGKQIIYRTTAFTPGKEAEEHAIYTGLLKEDKVRPHSMDLMIIDADGKNRRRLTHLGQASFAPFFFPDDQRVIFSTNHADKEAGRNFDLFAVGVDGENLERITNYSGFDSFPIFDPSGRYLVFSSNRGGTQPGETNLFIAEWR